MIKFEKNMTDIYNFTIIINKPYNSNYFNLITLLIFYKNLNLYLYYAILFFCFFIT